MMRGSGPGFPRDFPREFPAGQYQDVSQITAVQVTPRPKPRAFPRTNPSYVSVHRRDGNPPAVGNPLPVNPPSAFRHVDTMAASSAFNYHQARGGPSNHAARYYPSSSGAHTLQTSRSYMAAAEKAQKSGDVGGADNDDVDSDSSLSSSSSDASANGLRRQYTLDSNPSRHCPPSDMPPEGFSVGISPTQHSKSSESSPLVEPGPVRRSQRHAVRQPKSEPEIPVSSSEIPPPRVAAIPNGVARPAAARRNSEPDYVNVPSKSEYQLASNVREGGPGLAASEKPQKSGGGAVREPANADDERVSRSGEGTLRIRDQVASTADYVNCQDIVVISSTVNSGHPMFEGTMPVACISLFTYLFI